MPDPAVKAFLFGKMPAHGDFVSRGLASAERDRWDDWLTREMQAAAALHGDLFLDRYARAPVWRFVRADAAGVLACSIDSVGRRFPLLAGRTDEASSDALAEACEEQLYSAFQHGWTADILVDALAAIDPPASGGVVPDRWGTPGNDAFAENSLSGRQPDGLLARMLTPSGAVV